MNIKKITSKIIIALILVMLLFNFILPLKSHALLFDKIVNEIRAAPAHIFWWMEQGILTWLNDTFSNSDYQAKTIDHEGDRELVIKLTPETIIKGRFLIFDANIFREVKDNPDKPFYDYGTDGLGKVVVEGKTGLRKTIAGWYMSIRNFSIVALLSVLVYVGIRMVISTLAQDKAKYKTMFKDWLVALCLVVFMHYFMISILHITSLITDALGGGQNTNIIAGISADINAVLDCDWGSDYETERNGVKLDLGDAYAKIFVMGGIIVYTIIFAVKYLKREFTIMFLTIIGPAACITYPIDKIGDGKAQAYNRWFAEYLYQVIVQPFHLLLYIVLIGTATEMANINILYSLVCFAVMGPAEKFIKEMFGFKDKLGSPLGNMMKAGMARDLVSKATSRFMGGKGGNGGAGGNNSGDNNQSLPQSPTTRDIDNNLLGGANAEDVGDMAGNVAAINTLNEGNGQRESTSNSMDNQMNNAQENEVESQRMREQIEDGTRDAVEDNSDSDENRRVGDGTDGTSDQNGRAGTTDEINKNSRLRRAGRFIRSGVRHPFKTFDNTRIGKTHAQRMLKKHGTTSRKKRLVKRTGKAAKGVLKGTGKLAKLAGIAGIATVGAGIALATGNGGEAFAIATGAAGIIASDVGKSAKRTIKGAATYTKGAAKDYYNNDSIPVISNIANSKFGHAFGQNKEDREFKAFEQNQDEQNGAILNFRKNHGRDPNNSELRQEMKDRFALSQYGLSSDQIDKAVGEYQKLRAANIANAEQIKDKEARSAALESAPKRAADQAAFQAQLADRYKNKFGKEKEMQDAIKAVTKRFTDAGVAEPIAKANAIKYLNNAAKMNKETMILPGNSQTIEAPIERQRTAPNVMQYFVKDDLPPLDNEQIETMNNITLKLIEKGGLTNEQIEVIAQTSVPSGDISRMDANELINQYAISAEFVLDNKQRNHTVKVMKKNGQDATNQAVNEKMVDKLVMTHKFNFDPKKDTNKIYGIEKQESNLEISQVELARQMATEDGKGKLESEGFRKTKRKELRTQLLNGGTSKEQVEKDLDNLFRLADSYVGINNYNPGPNTSQKKIAKQKKKKK